VLSRVLLPPTMTDLTFSATEQIGRVARFTHAHDLGIADEQLDGPGGATAFTRGAQKDVFFMMGTMGAGTR
jgi:hypothetical protein